jgi:hypothetical protein
VGNRCGTKGARTRILWQFFTDQELSRAGSTLT